nr:uncharacterized protein LOC124810862 [Hydra vulgaris]
MACKRSKDEPSECNSFLQSSKRMGQVATHILTAESEVEIDFNTSKKKTQENSFKSTKQKEKKKCIFEEPPLPSLPLWEPPKLPDSDSVYILKFYPICKKNIFFCLIFMVYLLFLVTIF